MAGVGLSYSLVVFSGVLATHLYVPPRAEPSNDILLYMKTAATDGDKDDGEEERLLCGLVRFREHNVSVTMERLRILRFISRTISLNSEPDSLLTKMPDIFEMFAERWRKEEEPTCERSGREPQTSSGTRSEFSTSDQSEEQILQLRCLFTLCTFVGSVMAYCTVIGSPALLASMPRRGDCYSNCNVNILMEESQPLSNGRIEPTEHLSEVTQPSSTELICNASTYALISRRKRKSSTTKVRRRSRNYLTPGKTLALIFIIFQLSVFIANNINSKEVIDVDQFHQQHVNAKNWESEIAGVKNAFDIDELEEALLDMDPRNWRPTAQHLWIYTVPRYPDNHNPLLPLLLQQRLDEMNPREFLTYVLKELTLEERESLMVDEKQRRKTFLANWPLANNLSGIAMAKAGFYCLNDYDRVQCVFCRGCLHRWETDDIPLTEHAKSFNFCRFVKGLECGNREYRSNMLSEDDIRNITRYCCIGDSTEQRGHYNKDGVADSGLLGISTNRAAAIQYAPHASRMRTFSRWSPSCSISAQRMCDAGFYYTGFDDQVRCFFCAGGIRDWGDNDDPCEEHAKWFPDCAFLLQQKGEAYVEEVHARTPSNNKCSRKTQSQKKAEIKKVKHKSEQESMKTICEKLGHRSDVIDRTVSNNGRPFDNIRDMLDAIYNVEEDDTERPISGENKSLVIPSTNQSHVVCPEDDRRNLLEQSSRSIPITPGQFDGSEHEQKFKMGCRNCELKTATFVPATRVGLPCGHLIYCESCNAEELKKSEQSGSTGSASRCPCPYPRCRAPLTGSIRVYFA